MVKIVWVNNNVLSRQNYPEIIVELNVHATESLMIYITQEVRQAKSEHIISPKDELIYGKEISITQEVITLTQDMLVEIDGNQYFLSAEIEDSITEE